MMQNKRTKAAVAKHAPPTAGRHPHLTVRPASWSDDGIPEQPFAEGSQDELDPDLRHRMISEVAFHRQAERGYDEGYERDDWSDAEAEVNHLAIGPKPE